jgi:MFS family permease
MSASNSRVRWFALIALTGINLLNYIDRYIFSALLPAIKADLGFTDTQLGILGSAFLFAYTFASPIFGYLGDRGGRSRLMATGVGLWSLATAFSGMTTSFIGQFVTRAAVGLGSLFTR